MSVGTPCTSTDEGAAPKYFKLQTEVTSAGGQKHSLDSFEASKKSSCVYFSEFQLPGPSAIYGINIVTLAQTGPM